MLLALPFVLACGDDGRRLGGRDLGSPGDMTVPTDIPRRDIDAQPLDLGECNDVVDVVFVLDVSSSMSFVREQLGDDVGEVRRTAASVFRPFAHPGAEAPHHCAFVDAPFGDGGLQVACPDHSEASDQQAADAFRRLLRVVH